MWWIIFLWISVICGFVLVSIWGCLYPKKGFSKREARRIGKQFHQGDKLLKKVK